MNERIIHLRIKIKSLAAEATIIRKEARKTKGIVKYNLNSHRTHTVCFEARASLLAYGILRGVPYNIIEQKCDEAPDFAKVADIAKRFGADKVQDWIQAAKDYIKE